MSWKRALAVLALVRSSLCLFEPKNTQATAIVSNLDSVYVTVDDLFYGDEPADCKVYEAAGVTQFFHSKSLDNKTISSSVVISRNFGGSTTYSWQSDNTLLKVNIDSTKQTISSITKGNLDPKFTAETTCTDFTRIPTFPDRLFVGCKSPTSNLLYEVSAADGSVKAVVQTAELREIKTKVRVAAGQLKAIDGSVNSYALYFEYSDQDKMTNDSKWVEVFDVSDGVEPKYIGQLDLTNITLQFISSYSVFENEIMVSGFNSTDKYRIFMMQRCKLNTTNNVLSLVCNERLIKTPAYNSYRSIVDFIEPRNQFMQVSLSEPVANKVQARVDTCVFFSNFSSFWDCATYTVNVIASGSFKLFRAEGSRLATVIHSADSLQGIMVLFRNKLSKSYVSNDGLAMSGSVVDDYLLTFANKDLTLRTTLPDSVQVVQPTKDTAKKTIFMECTVLSTSEVKKADLDINFLTSFDGLELISTATASLAATVYSNNDPAILSFPNTLFRGNKVQLELTSSPSSYQVTLRKGTEAPEFKWNTKLGSFDVEDIRISQELALVYTKNKKIFVARCKSSDITYECTQLTDAQDIIGTLTIDRCITPISSHLFCRTTGSEAGKSVFYNYFDYGNLTKFTLSVDITDWAVYGYRSGQFQIITTTKAEQKLLAVNVLMTSKSISSSSDFLLTEKQIDVKELCATKVFGAVPPSSFNFRVYSNCQSGASTVLELVLPHDEPARGAVVLSKVDVEKNAQVCAFSDEIIVATPGTSGSLNVYSHSARSTRGKYTFAKDTNGLSFSKITGLFCFPCSSTFALLFDTNEYVIMDANRQLDELNRVVSTVIPLGSAGAKIEQSMYTGNSLLQKIKKTDGSFVHTVVPFKRSTIVIKSKSANEADIPQPEVISFKFTNGKSSTREIQVKLSAQTANNGPTLVSTNQMEKLPEGEVELSSLIELRGHILGGYITEKFSKGLLGRAIPVSSISSNRVSDIFPKFSMKGGKIMFGVTESFLSTEALMLANVTGEGEKFKVSFIQGIGAFDFALTPSICKDCFVVAKVDQYSPNKIHFFYMNKSEVLSQSSFTGSANSKFTKILYAKISGGDFFTLLDSHTQQIAFFEIQSSKKLVIPQTRSASIRASDFTIVELKTSTSADTYIFSTNPTSRSGITRTKLTQTGGLVSTDTTELSISSGKTIKSLAVCSDTPQELNLLLNLEDNSMIQVVHDVDALNRQKQVLVYEKVPGMEYSDIACNKDHLAAWAVNPANTQDVKLIIYSKSEERSIWAINSNRVNPIAMFTNSSGSHIVMTQNDSFSAVQIYRIEKTIKVDFTKIKKPLENTSLIFYSSPKGSQISVDFNSLIKKPPTPTPEKRGSSWIVTTLLILFLLVIFAAAAGAGLYYYQWRKNQVLLTEADPEEASYSKMQSEKSIAQNDNEMPA